MRGKSGRWAAWAAGVTVALAGLPAGGALAWDRGSPRSVEHDWTLSDDVVLELRANLTRERSAARPFAGLDEAESRWDGSLGDTTAELRLFGDRIRLATQHGWSQDDFGAGLSAVGSDAYLGLARSDTNPIWDQERFLAPDAGQSMSQSIDVRLLQSGPVRISAFGRLQRANESFRGLDGGAVANQRALDYGAQIDVGPVVLKLSEVSQWQGSADSEDEGVLHRRYKADLALSLHGLRNRAQAAIGSPASLLTPDSLWVSFARGTAEPAQAVATDATRDESLGLTWNWGSASASLSAWRSLYDGRQPSAESADWEGRGADLGMGYYRERWDVYVTLGIGHYANLEESTRSVDRSYDTSLSLSLRPDALPDVTQTLSYSQYDTDYLASDGKSRSGAWAFTTTLDLSKYLPRRGVKQPLKLMTTYRHSQGRYRDSFAASDADREDALFAFLRLDF